LRLDECGVRIVNRPQVIEVSPRKGLLVGAGDGAVLLRDAQLDGDDEDRADRVASRIGLRPAERWERRRDATRARHGWRWLPRLVSVGGVSRARRRGDRARLRLAGEGPDTFSMPRRVPDLRRMHEILGVRATVSLVDGIRRTIDWFRAEGGASA
jgi:hypothetical protein